MFAFPPSSMSPAPDALDADAFDIVHPSLLIPPDVPIRGFSRCDAGIVLDRELVALAGAEARCRLVRARIAARLLATRAWRALGFVRLGDFARERLGVSPRSLEDDAHTVNALEALPVLRSALECGLLTWSRLRILLRSAKPHNEARLLAASQSVAMRDLETFVAAFGAGGDQDDQHDLQSGNPCSGDLPSDDPQAGDPRSVDPRSVDPHAGDPRLGDPHSGDPCSADPMGNPANAASSIPPTTDDDLCVRWSMHVSRSGRRMWRAVSELAARHAGSPLSPAQVLELVAAEACGSACGPPFCENAAPSSCADAAPPPGEGAAPSQWAPTPEMHEKRFRDSLRATEERGRRFLLAFLAETGVAEGFAWLDPASGDPGPARSVDALAIGLETCDAFELEARLQSLRALSQRLDAQIAALMRTGIDRRLFREIGFATVKLYAEARLGLSARRIWNLVTLERESWRHSRMLHDAFRDGRLTALQAMALLPVINDAFAWAWIERASQVTLRRLQDEVA